VYACGRGQTQTDTQTRVTTIYFASSTTHMTCKEQNAIYLTVQISKKKKKHVKKGIKRTNLVVI